MSSRCGGAGAGLAGAGPVRAVPDRRGGSLDGVIWLIAPLHVISALALVFLVLLHSGKGGGLSDMFGGGLGAQAAGSTVVERNLDRITIISALVFGFASISYALII